MAWLETEAAEPRPAAKELLIRMTRWYSDKSVACASPLGQKAVGADSTCCWLLKCFFEENQSKTPLKVTFGTDFKVTQKSFLSYRWCLGCGGLCSFMALKVSEVSWFCPGIPESDWYCLFVLDLSAWKNAWYYLKVPDSARCPRNPQNPVA